MSPAMGCVIVTYNSSEHILNCLQSLQKATSITLKVIIVDNASNDTTVRLVRDWSDQNSLDLALIQAPHNLGFAAGVNLGLTELLSEQMLDRFWILNPDCTVPASTPMALAQVRPPFALLGSRILYDCPRPKIQIDGGQLNTWTGATKNANLGQDPSDTPLPSPSALDFISGASMVASRDFVEASGLMPEQYFLYYEEVDWALKRRQLPLAICNDAIVYHSAGASIGSPTLSRGPSPLSAYFKHRARMKFMAAHYPRRLLVAYLFGWMKILQHICRKQFSPVPSILSALHGLEPNKRITTALGTHGHDVTKSRTQRINPS